MIKHLLRTITLAIALFLPILSLCPAYAEEASTSADETTSAESSESTNNADRYVDDKHQSTNVDQNNKKGDTLDFTDSCPQFFGIKSWYCGLDFDKIQDEEALKGSIVIIIVNITEGFFVIAGYLLLGFILYGGFKYLISTGDSAKIASAKKTITNSIIGIVIIALSYIILNTIRIALLGSEGTFDECDAQACVTPEALIGNALTWVYSIVALIAVAFIVYAGVSYITSNGDANKVLRAKQTIVYAIIGLIVIALAFIITNFVINTINNSTKSTEGLLPQESYEITIS